KRTTEFLHLESFQALIRTLNADRFVVYGVVTEICVKDAAFGLLATGKPVELVTDAIKELNSENGQQVLAAFQTNGGKLTTAAAVMAS
ncbi:MAG: isochorismatase family protein, partial [Candidatus Solibacter usitatus]|nr:isochorismatase family protein [Candidatus Solibacter usitatus]